LTISQEDAMKRRSFIAAATIGFIFLLAVGITAEAADLKVLSAFGMQSVLEDLGPTFERATGHQLTLAFATGGATVKRVQGGEAADVVITLRPGIDTLVQDGKASAGSVTEVARAGIAVAVRRGAPKPDISSPDALTRTLLAATSIAYVDPASGGASGIHVAKVLERLGIAREMHAKTVFPDPKTPAEVGVVVANGEAEIGVHLIQELIPVTGLEIVGPLPGDLQHTMVFAAAIMTGAKDLAAAQALVEFLRTPESAQVIEAKGMDPGPPP
jgi:molybdate transport system substrate-binding protein